MQVQKSERQFRVPGTHLTPSSSFPMSQGGSLWASESSKLELSEFGLALSQAVPHDIKLLLSLPLPWSQPP